MTTSSPAAATTVVSDLKAKIERRQARVAIIGLGYVGLPLALLFTEQKMRVTGFDIDQRKITTLTQGGTYIVRILASDQELLQSRKFVVSGDDTARALAGKLGGWSHLRFTCVEVSNH
jgi:UDP-N-acetyl-D-glucosamine dehydrogenase